MYVFAVPGLTFARDRLDGRRPNALGRRPACGTGVSG